MKAMIAACLYAGLVAAAGPARALADPALDLESMTVARMQQQMAAGQLTSVQLTRAYLNRIAAVNTRGPGLNAVRILNPHALQDAAVLDLERATGRRNAQQAIDNALNRGTPDPSDDLDAIMTRARR